MWSQSVCVEVDGEAVEGCVEVNGEAVDGCVEPVSLCGGGRRGCRGMWSQSVFLEVEWKCMEGCGRDVEDYGSSGMMLEGCGSFRRMWNNVEGYGWRI